MNGLNRAERIILAAIIVVILAAAFTLIYILFIAEKLTLDENTDRIILFTTNKVGNSDCILVQSQGFSGLIDTSNRSSSVITDYDGEEYDVPAEAGLSNEEYLCNGESIAKYLMYVLKIDHLDFIIATHAHSDHIGGLEEIANSGLVNSRTRLFYKTYSHDNYIMNDGSIYPSDDLPDDTLMSFDKNGDPVFYSAGTGEIKEDVQKNSDSGETPYHNQAFLYAGIKACAEKGAQLIDVSERRVLDEEKEQENTTDISEVFNNVLRKVDYQMGDTGNYYDDYLSFDFGNFNVKLFNLFINTDLQNSDNGNSIVALISKDGKTYLNWSDMNVENRGEQKVAKAIYELAGHIDVTKPGHHSTNEGSSALETYDLLQPGYAIKSMRAQYYHYWTSQKYGTQFLSINEADDGIVITFDDDGELSFNVLTERYGFPELKSIDQCLLPLDYPKERWSLSIKKYPDMGTSETQDWAYFDENGEVATGWRKVKERWYYLDPDNYGLMATGWKTIEGKKYYLSDRKINKNGKVDLKLGEMYKGRRQIIENGETHYYYFAKTDSEVEGFPEGAMITNKTIDGYTYDEKGISN